MTALFWIFSFFVVVVVVVVVDFWGRPKNSWRRGVEAEIGIGATLGPPCYGAKLHAPAQLSRGGTYRLKCDVV